MSVSSFIHVNKAENKDFDLEKFNREMEKKYGRQRWILRRIGKVIFFLVCMIAG